MSNLRLFLLGPPRVEADGLPVDVKRRKALALLVYLAVSGQPHSRDALATLFFPELDQQRARAYLRRDLAALNTGLPGNWLAADRETIELKADRGVWLDIEQFQRCLATSQTHNHPPAEVCADCLPLLTEATTLYSDHFLAGFTLPDSPDFDEWQFFQAESLRQEYALTLKRLVAGLCARQEFDPAIPYARRWVALDPLYEPAQFQLIQLFDRAGQQAAAMRQYEEYVKLLEEELGIPPEEKTQTLYEAIKAKRILEPHLKQVRPPVPSPPATALESGPGPSSTPAPLPAQLGRYELLAEIGQGGFATVYRARDMDLDRLVALKELDSHLLANTTWVKRFRQEGQLIARLDHPRIVTVYELSEVQGRLFIVMRLVEGPCLADLLANRGYLSWPETVEMISAVAEGLDYAHRNGILHRDLKPANILIDPGRGPLLSDFGLAKLVGENSLSRSGEVVGTPYYIAPELWDGQEARAQTDIYALGSILYEMLTGQKLFAGKTPPSVMKAHFQPLTLPDSWPEGVPPGVADILRKTLARQPDDRFAAADDLVTALVELPTNKTAGTERPTSQTRLTLAAQQRDAGNYAAAIDLLEPLLVDDPADERLHRELMRLYALAGRRHEALRQYQRCAETLATELARSPDLETEALYRQVVNGDVTLPLTSTPESGWLPPAPIAVELERGAPLVGRELELETVQDKIRAGWQGQGCTVLLAGDSGVGKTRLAYEALQTVAQAGITTLVGAAYEQEGHLPYHPFIEAFDRYLAEQQHPPEQNPITHYQPLGVTDLQKENTALFQATASFLTGLTTSGPVVLLLDDLHAADEASLSMFHYLARQTRSTPVILLATYRTDIASNGLSPFGSLLNALYREHLSQVLHLKPLPEEAGAEIINHTLGGKADPTLVKAIFNIAEGNPFYVQEISRAALKEKDLVQAGGKWRLKSEAVLQVPSELRELLRERVQRLGPTVESTLTAAAVVGRDFRFAVLRHVTGLPDGDLFDALDAALAAHLLEETNSGYRFQHPLIRHTLYDALSRRRRAWLHTRTGDAIEATFTERPEGLKPHIEALAFHYELSDRRDKALPYLSQAAQNAAAVFALEVANDYLERVLALMDELGVDDPARRWPILEQLGTLAKVLANTKRAITYYEQALVLLPTNEWHAGPNDRVRLHRSLARTFIAAGRMAEAEQHLQAATEIVVDNGQASLDYANLLYDVSLWHWHNDEYQAAFEAAQRSLDIAEQLDDVVARAQAYEMLALACHALGEWQQGLTYEEQRSTLAGPNLDVTEAFDAHL